MNKISKKSRIAALVLTLVLALSCFCIAPSASAVETANVSATASHGGDTFSWDNASVYFLLTDRFYNGNKLNDHAYKRATDANENPLSGWDNAPATFHGGDFAGITQKIQEGYFNDLGINALWISAPYEQIHGYVDSGKGFAHYSYHEYYVLDYTEADGNFGTKEEFEQLVDTAHEHGIRVVIDIVMNHTGYNTVADMEEYNYGTLLPGASEFKYKLDNVAEVNSHIDFVTSAEDWGRWWGFDWIRSGLPGYTKPGGNDLTRDLEGLPDLMTESTKSVGIPPLLKTKWTQEGTYNEKIAKYGSTGTVSDYLTTWLAEWVKDYGVDGFRCDTAKHVEYASWNKLKTKCVAALKEWRKNNPNKPGADWTDDFWMTGEVWDHGVDYDDYYKLGGFDSLINFSTCGGGSLASSGVANLYQGYADKINTNDNFNVLSFISSHDEVLARGDQNTMIYNGSALMLLPGAVQIFYGDESNRPSVPGLAFDGSGGSGHSLRSDMNWNSMDETLLAHYQKVGSFRNNHIAVGAGSNIKLTATGGVGFARVYDKNNILDKVAAVIGAGSNQDITIDVSSIWEDGQEVVNTYDDSSATVANGKVKFNSGAHGTILIQEPDGKPLIKLDGESANFSGTQKITLTIDGADSAKVSVDGGNKFVVNNGGTFTIGENAYPGSYVKVTAQATNDKGTSTKVATYYKLNTGEIEPPTPNKDAIIHVKPYDANTNIYVWTGTGAGNAKELLGAWPGKNIKNSGTPDADGYYTFNLDTTDNYSFIINGAGAQTGDQTGNVGEIWIEATSNSNVKIKEQEESGMDKLKTLATSCKVMTASEYTAATWNAVSTALTSADAVIAKGDNATNEEINSAISTLTTAKSGLKIKAPSITTMAAGGTVISGKTAAGADVTVKVGSTSYKAAADDITGVYSVKVSALKSTDNVTITATKNSIPSETTARTVAQGPTGDEQTYIVGDVNLDGNVKLIDALLAARHGVKLETLTGMSFAAADVDADGNVTLADAILIQKYVARLNTSSAVGTVRTYKK